jgi:hypothetical protein
MKTGNVSIVQSLEGGVQGPEAGVQSPMSKVQSQRCDSRAFAARGIDPPAWWTRLPVGERALIRAVVRMLRSARRSRVREVARAAVKWERGICCFIKVRLITEKQKAESRKLKWGPN